jgi:sugar (glycoside-pentoside-hexuronide) transporter
MQEQTFVTSRGERTSYGVYFFGQLTFFILTSSFLQLYLTDIGIPAAMVGGILVISKVWDAINDPVFGIIVDKSRLKSGKYLPWVRLSTLLIPAATIFMFAVPSSMGVQAKALWSLCAYILWSVCYTICDVPIFALATSMTNSIKERDRLFILNRFFTFVGGITVTVVIPLLYPAIGWTATVVIMSALGALTMVPVGLKAKERYFTGNQKTLSLKELGRYFIHNKYLLIFNGAIIIMALSGTSAAVQNYCAIYCLGGPRWITILALVVTLPMLLAVFFTPRLIARIDKSIVSFSCLGASLFTGLILFFAGYTNLVVFFILITLRAIFSSMIGVALVMFTADCAEYGNYKTGERAQGLAFSIQTFTAKITGALSSAVCMFVLAFAGFAEGSGALQSQTTIDWIWRLYTLFPIFTGVAALALLVLGYKLRSRDVAVMMRCNNGEISREEAEAAFSRRY